jgi:hypothetical protein
MAGGWNHNLGLRSDGTVATWGSNEFGQCDVPAPNADFVQVAGGGWHSLGLRADSTIVAWGGDFYGQCDVPAPNADFVAVAAGAYHSLGLRADGTLLAWGENGSGQCTIPSPNEDFVGIAAGAYFSLGLRSDGTLLAWGANELNQCDVPAPNAGFLAIAAGAQHCLALQASSMSSIEPADPGGAPGADTERTLAVAPNPAWGGIDVFLEMRETGRARLELYDVGGRRVSTLPVELAGPGRKRIRWDGCDASGTRVAPGLYFLRMRGAVRESGAVRLLLVR